MSKLHTLTVPDMQWINLQITGAPQKYDFAKLEEGTFYQYKSGANNDIAGQAAKFLVGFSKMQPFTKGNHATAFAASLAYLKMNNVSLDVEPKDAHAWLRDIGADETVASKEISRVMKMLDDHDHQGVPPAKEIVTSVLDRYSDCIAKLAKES